MADIMVSVTGCDRETAINLIKRSRTIRYYMQSLLMSDTVTGDSVCGILYLLGLELQKNRKLQKIGIKLTPNNIYTCYSILLKRAV